MKDNPKAPYRHLIVNSQYLKIYFCIFLTSILICLSFTLNAQTEPIIPDTSNTDRKGKIFPSPVVGYTPETRLYFGAGCVYYLPPSKKYPETNPAVLKLVAVYTLNKQIESNFSGDSYYKNNLYKFNYSISYFEYPDHFFGIGNYTLEEDREKYDFDFFNFYFNAQRLVHPNFYAGIKTFFENTKVYNKDSTGFFSTQEIIGEDGGRNTGLGLWLTYDTRDNIYFPLEGMNIDVSGVVHNRVLGSDFNYVDYLLEISQFNKMGKDDVLGFNFYGIFVPGSPPFNRLAELGGDKHMRGNFEGRFRDQNYLSLQSEYRITFWKYFAVNIFAGIGEVADEFSNFSASGLKYSFGAGGRLFIVPEDKLSLRVDYAFGSEGQSGLYVTFREAF